MGKTQEIHLMSHEELDEGKKTYLRTQDSTSGYQDDTLGRNSRPLEGDKILGHFIRTYGTQEYHPKMG